MLHSSVTLTRKLRLAQALKNAGIENPAAVVRLTIAGTMTKSDFAYIRENMHETLHRLDMREASVRKNKIPDGAFNNCRALSAVIIPDTSTEIGDCIFNMGNRMRSFTIPASVVKMNGAASFEDCKFRTITVHPDNPAYASDDGVLFNKDKTVLLLYPAGRKGDYTVPASVVKIAGSAFTCCEVATLTIPETVKEIEDCAFNHCAITSSLVFPASVTDISHRKFCDCYLTEIVIHPDNPVYSSKDGVLFNKDKTELIIYPNWKEGSYNVPSLVVKIADRAFYDCSKLWSVVIPNSVIEIGSEAFFDCKGLLHIDIPVSVIKIANDILNRCPVSIAVHPDNPAYASDEGVLFNKDKTELIYFPNSKGDYVVPSSVVKIADRAFAEHDYCEYYEGVCMKSVVIPYSVTEIGSEAFYNCKGLTAVDISSSVVVIKERTFGGCRDLKSITIPASVIKIANDTFEDCRAYITVHPDNPVYTSENGKIKRKEHTKKTYHSGKYPDKSSISKND